MRSGRERVLIREWMLYLVVRLLFRELLNISLGFVQIERIVFQLVHCLRGHGVSCLRRIKMRSRRVIVAVIVVIVAIVAVIVMIKGMDR